MLGLRRLLGLTLLIAACGPVVTGDTDGDEGSSSTRGENTSTSSVPPNPSTTASPSTSTTSPGTTTDPSPESSSSDDTGSSDTTTGGFECPDGNCLLDIVVVVDNSRYLARAQHALARGMVELETQLRALGADVQVMFTTSDMGNPNCTPFEPEGYDPARGEPIATACNQRLQDFTGLGSNPESDPGACTEICPVAVAPQDPFVAFGPGGDNIAGGVRDEDITGDGRPETPAAQALACLTPMGINGCGFESPLESMLQALNPDAAWNQGPRPFVRPDAALGIVLLTDELDCSIRDFQVMNEEQFWETNPENGTPTVSSALCWNASIECTDAGGGTYDCAPNDLEFLHPLDRYRNYLVDFLVESTNKPVFMLGLFGVPEGGYDEVIFRDWTDDDVLPADAMNGATAASQQFNFRIGPGCTRPDSTSRGQGIPPVRAATLCNQIADGQGGEACCMQSICDDEYTAGLSCLVQSFVASQDG